MSATDLDRTARKVRPRAESSEGRPVVLRTRGRGHGEAFRLMGPTDLGQRLKPFVLLDSFSGSMDDLVAATGVHPHSGIATATVITRGDVHFKDPDSGNGTIGCGGVEWVSSGGGVWHGKELSSGVSERIHAFQLWLALPPAQELQQPRSQFIEARHIPRSGPASIILGSYGGACSPVESPDGINYLLVTLAPGERWAYAPPKGHVVGWVAVSSGRLVATSTISHGELAVFAPGDAPIDMKSGPSGATFVLGSATAHPHPLHLGYYSVHTTAEALKAGERNIDAIRQRLFALGDPASAPVPTYRA